MMINSKKIGKLTAVVSLALFCLILCGCSRLNTALSEESGSGYYIYYTNADGTSLIKSKYVPTAENFDGILMELLDCFQNPVSTELISVLPSSVKLNGYTMGVDNLTVDFNAAYLGLTNVQEILLRAGIVKTLVQLPGVQNVSVTVDGQPLKESDGTLIGSMNDETFIDSQGNGINSIRYLDLDLYFADATGKGIVKETRSGTFSSNLSVESVIVEEIIRGPQTPGLLAVVSPDVQVNDVKTVDDTCILNFDNSFNEVYNPDLSPEAVIYAFVNSICESSNAESVQIQVEGSSDVRFLDQLSLDQTFVRNAEILPDAPDEPETQTETPSADDQNADDQAADKVLIGLDADHADENN